MIRYVAFLRGLNVGGSTTLKMDMLESVFALPGISNIRTVLTSGNVVFDTAEKDTETLVVKIEKQLEKVFGLKVVIILRTVKEIKKLSDLNPFKGIKVDPKTKFYVTFLSEKPRTDLKAPYTSPDKDFKIVRVSYDEVCSMLYLSPDQGTTDLMKFLEKEFGRGITTRNWNTIDAILKNE